MARKVKAEDKKKKNKEVEAVYEEIEEKEEEEELEEELEEDVEEETEDEEDTEEETEDEDSEDDDEEEEDNEEVVENPVRKPMSDKTKYILIGIIGVLIVIICVLIFFKDEKSLVKDRDVSTEFLQEFYKEYDAKNTNVIFFASATCGYCTMQKPILENISKDYKMDYYSIDAATLSDDEKNEVIKALGIQGATPTTVVLKNGKVVATNEGYLDGKELVEFFAENGAIDSEAIYKQEDRIIPITYTKFKEISDKKEASLILVDQSACSSCITVREVLNKIATDNDFRVNYLNAAYLSQEEGEKFVQKDLEKMGYKADAYKKDKTVNIPLLLVVKNGKIKDYVLQKTEKSDYTKVLKKHGFIK